MKPDRVGDHHEIDLEHACVQCRQRPASDDHDDICEQCWEANAERMVWENDYVGH